MEYRIIIIGLLITKNIDDGHHFKPIIPSWLFLYETVEFCVTFIKIT
jgi:hypothetical protein